MSTPKTVKQLVKDISALSSTLLDAVPRGSKDDNIWSVMNTNEGDSLLHEMFNCQFDALFGEDCHDPGGHLHHICQGKLGMGIIISYLSKINWANDFSLDVVELKLPVDVPPPVQTVNPTAKLKDTANSEAPQLSFQCKAVQEFHSQQANKNNPPPASSTLDANLHALSLVSLGLSPQNWCSNLSINDSNSEDEIVDQPVPHMSFLPPMSTF
ncbi:hypothetical protein F5148DRAFT_1287514 [Russula earlei]|uniref:Uncharacterized protein n=1 Tax=Russula earlei TaxID=71964 RepID=A0ACC0U1K0_9AGAM|nr:hypothetical protein F5148DRAFT_1287514 [Russula earlei]